MMGSLRVTVLLQMDERERRRDGMTVERSYVWATT